MSENAILINDWCFERAAPNAKCDWGIPDERSGNLVLCNKGAVVIGPRPRIPLCDEHAHELAEGYKQAAKGK